MNARNPLLGAAILAALQVPAAALAQSATMQLEEVLVTAQKREQRFGDVGISGTAYTGEALAEAGVAQLTDLALLTPNVQIKYVMANSIPNVTIRGIGLNDYAANNNPAAGIYIDDVYLVSPAMLTFGMFDLERVEVLKGPQGTLFGRNTTAGTINFISKKPGDQLDGYLTLDVGNYERILAEGAIGGPFTDTLSARFAIQTIQQGEGFQTNRLNGQKIGEVDRTSARGELQWKPSDDVNVLLSLYGGKDKSDVWLIKIDNPFTTEDDGDTDPYRSGASNDPHMDLENTGANLTIDWSLSDALTLTSVTGYQDFSRFHVEDRDATSLIMLDGTFDNQIDQFSEEVRLTHVGDNLVLIGGAFYGEDSVDTRDEFLATDLLALLGLAGVDVIGNEYQQDTTSMALFLHSEWSFTENWKLTAGARYTDESKDFAGAYTFLIAGGTEVPLYPDVVDTYDTDNVSGKIGLDYSGIEDTLLYASVSRGFKSGGFQGQLSFDPAALLPFGDEEVLAYEVGMKSRLAGNSRGVERVRVLLRLRGHAVLRRPVRLAGGRAVRHREHRRRGSEGRRGRPLVAADGRARPALRPRLSRHGDHELGGRRRRDRQRAAELAGVHLQLRGALRVGAQRNAHDGRGDRRRLPGQRHLRHRPGAARGDRGQLLAL